jgi:iron complex outermembrane recepter protein
MEFYAKQDRVYLADNTETSTPGYTLFNAGIGTDITNHSGKVLFSINIVGSNITNVLYQSHLSRLKYMDFYIDKEGKPVNVTGAGSGIYNMGRNFSVKITVPLNFKL